MFVQSHIQRTHRQNSTNKFQAQQHQQHQHLSSRNSGKSNPKQADQTINKNKGRKVSNRRISRDFSFDIPNGGANLRSGDLNYCSDSRSNSAVNNNNSDRHLVYCPNFDSNYKLESYHNSTEVDTNDAFDEENEESLLVQLNDSFKLGRCHLRSIDSFVDSSSLAPKSSQSLQIVDDGFGDLPPRANYQEFDINGAEEFEKYGGRNSVESFMIDTYFEANTGVYNELDCEQKDAMIANSSCDNNDDDDYQDISLKIETIGETEGPKLATNARRTLIKEIIDIEEKENLSSNGRRQQQQQQFISRYSIISCSKKNFELVSSFCRNFITYQFETWRLLAGCATNCKPQIISSPISEINSQRSSCSICHIVQTNVPKPPPRGKVFDSEEVELGLDDIGSSDCNKNLLIEDTRLSSSQPGEQTQERATTMIDRTNYTPYVGQRPVLQRAFTSDSQRIAPNINHLVRPNNAYLQYAGNHSDTNNSDLLGYQHNLSQRAQTPFGYADRLNYRSNPMNGAPSSIEEQNLVIRGSNNGSFSNGKRHTQTGYPHHLYRASTGIELRNESASRGEGDSFFSPNQQLLDYSHHHHHNHQHNHHHHNHHQCQHRKLMQNYGTKTADFPPSSSGSFDLSLDEKFPIPPPVSDATWIPIRPHNNQNNLNEQQVSGETKSIGADWSRNTDDATRTRQHFDSIRSTTFSRSSSREQERDGSGRIIEKRVNSLLLENKKKTGSDSELCSIKREQVSQQAEASIRQASTSKPVSIEKINNDVDQLEKLNSISSAKDDSRTVSPNSVDSSKLLTVGFSRFSKRISPSKLGLAGEYK